MPLSYESTIKAKALVIAAGVGTVAGMIVRSKYDELPALVAGLGTGIVSGALYLAKDEIAHRLSSRRIGRHGL